MWFDNEVFLHIFGKNGFLLLCLFLLISTSVQQNDDGDGDDAGKQLQLVQVLFRHGDRNPIDLSPNDPYKNESFWPEGFGQLTKRGKQQHFALGKFLRSRYGNFLSSSYSPYEILVQASDVDRTLMSAEVDLAGLYPPNPHDPASVWDEDSIGKDWQPIPIHTQPSTVDNKLRMSAPCPKLKKLVEDFDNGPEMERIYKENQDLFELLSNKSGKPVKTLQDMDYLYDALFIESLHNYTLPDWTKAVFPGGQFRNLTALSFSVLTWTAEMKRLKAGPLIKELVEHFQMKSEGSDKLDGRLKMFMYSGHDTTIASMLNALGMFNGLPPPFATCVILELYKDALSSTHYVKILYRNDSSHPPYPLRLPGCPHTYCPMESVIKLTNPVIPQDWESECKIGLWGLQGSALAALLISAFLTILLIVSMIVVKVMKRKADRETRYLHLQTEEEEA